MCHPKIHPQQGLGDLRIRCGANVGEEGEALIVGEKAASHLTPLLAPHHPIKGLLNRKIFHAARIFKIKPNNERLCIV